MLTQAWQCLLLATYQASAPFPLLFRSAWRSVRSCRCRIDHLVVVDRRHLRIPTTSNLGIQIGELAFPNDAVSRGRPGAGEPVRVHQCGRFSPDACSSGASRPRAFLLTR
jgi:hypothetical protein